MKSSGKLTRPFAQVQDMSGEIASLQPRACRDASEQTDAFEGKFRIFEFFPPFVFLYFLSVSPRVVKHVHIEIRSERLVSL